MLIKICGTTNLPDASLAVDLGANALGFIFAPSRRRVNAAQVAEITGDLPSHIERVGVFTNGDVAEISAVVREANLSAVQLHMTANMDLAAELHTEFGGALKLWQVLQYEVNAADSNVFDEAFAGSLADLLQDDRIAVTVIDAARNGVSGGLGVSYPWQRVAALVERARRIAIQARGRAGLLVIAGGMNPQNVGEAISALRPDGVDCVSGVEAEPGRKSADRLRAFIHAAREDCRLRPPRPPVGNEV